MDEFEARLQRVRAFLDEQRIAAFLITRQPNFHWLTGGGRGFVSLATEGAVAALLVQPRQVTLLSNDIEAGRLVQEELAGLPLNIRRFPWYDEGQRERHVAELTGGAPLGADAPVPGARHLPAFDQLRWTLTPAEQERARRLGREAAQATEQVCREFRRGETEFQVAGRLAAAFWSRGIEPTVLLVGADERACLYRHPLPTAKPVDRYALVAVCGRRHGLVVSLSRMVCFGPPAPELERRLAAAAAVDAALIAATRPGRTAGEVFAIGQQAYAAHGFPEEWQLHHQGGLAGYLGREYRGMPGGMQPIQAGQLFAWNPTVQGAKCEDTILVGPAGNEVLTATGEWPAGPAGRPGILVRGLAHGDG